VVRCCLNKQPDQRPRSATELALRYEQALGKRISHFKRSGATTNIRVPVQRLGAVSASTGATQSTHVALPRNAIQHSVEAVMPEALALVKLKGFIHDLGGQVVESVPGMIQVRLQEQSTEKKKSGLFGWLGGGSATATATSTTEIELHMERREPSQPNRLTI